MSKATMPHKTFIHFFITYGIFLLCFFLLMLPLFLRNLSIVQEKEMALSIARTEQNLAAFEAQYTAIQALVQNLGNDTRFRQILQASTLENKDYPLLGETSQYFARLIAPFPFVNDYGMFSGNGVIYAQQRMFVQRNAIPDQFYGPFFSLESFDTMEMWMAQMHQGIQFETITSNDHGAYPAFVFTFPVLVGNSQIPVAWAYVAISQENWLNAILPEEIRPAAMVTLHREGETLWGDMTLADSSAYYHDTLHDSLTGITLEIAYPIRMVRERLAPLYSILLLQMSLSLLGGLLLGLLFSYRSHMPMRKLLQVASVSMVPKDEATGGSNAYEYISHALRHMHRHLSEITEETQRRIKMLRQQFIEKAIHGALSDAASLGHFFELLPDFPVSYQLAMITLPQATHTSTLENDMTLLTLLEYELTEKLSNATFSLMLSPYLCIAVLPEKPTTPWAEKLAHIQQYFQEEHGLFLRMALSNTYEGPLSLAEAYQQARYIHRLCGGRFEAFVWQMDDFDTAHAQNPINYAMVQQLYDALSSGDIGNMRLAINRMKKVLSDENVIESTFALLQSKGMVDLACTILMHVKLEHFAALSHLQIPPSFTGRRPVLEQMQQIEHCCEVICETLGTRPKKEQTQTEAILAYIDAHLGEKDLYLSSIASAFHISEKTLQRMMRGTVPSTLSVYIETRRLEVAIELLRTHTLSVHEVGERAGFSSYNTFYKAFQRRYGMAPSAFRA